MRKLLLLILVPSLSWGGPLDSPLPEPERGSELATALTNAGPGAVIELKEGTYTGAFFITNKSDLTLRPQAGAHVVLTLRDPRFATTNALWQPLAAGVYQTPEFVGSSIYRMDGRRIPLAKDKNNFDEISAMGISIAFRDSSGSLIYLEGDDPRTTPLWISKTDQAVIACTNSPRVKIHGLDIRFGGAVGINAVACEDFVIEENTIYGGRDGVRLKNGDSPRAVVRRNWIVNYIDRRWWYRDMKGNVAFEGSGVTAPGTSTRVEENIITGWFNGIGTVSSSGSPTIDPIIRGNWIWDILDDAIEMDGVCVRGEVSENLIGDAFVGFSFAPRQVQTPGEDTQVHHNTVYATRKEHFDRTLGGCSDDFVGPGCGYPSGTKFNPGAPQDLVFEHNTIRAWRHAVRGAPSGGPPPVHVRWYDNVLISDVAPLVRETGLVTGQNDYQRNVYQLLTPAPNMFQLWNGTSSFSSLAKARVAAPEWEFEGREGTDITGRGAFEPRVPRQIDSRTQLATGWVLVRGQGLVPGLGVVSSTTAFENPAPGPPTLLAVEVR